MTAERKPRCWPWSHTWTSWLVIESGKLGRVRSAADQLLVPGEIVIGTYVSSPDPLQNGTTQVALCRKELKNFHWLVQIEPDGIPMGAFAKQQINPLTTCRICYQQDWPDGYLYLARAGEVEGGAGESH